MADTTFLMSVFENVVVFELETAALADAPADAAVTAARTATVRLTKIAAKLIGALFFVETGVPTR